MTNEKAGELIRRLKYHYDGEMREALEVVEEANKKQIPQKPITKKNKEKIVGNWVKVCPVCGRILVRRVTTLDESYPIIYNNTNHCDCGQRILWE